MLDKSLIGRVSEPVLHEVEKGAIRRFAEALGDGDPFSFSGLSRQKTGPPPSRYRAANRHR